MSDSPGATAVAPVTHLLYLHGFRSSPQSTKARKFAAWAAANRPELVWWCPQLPASPAAAMREVMDGTAAWPADRMAVVGSSLGGFYATAVAEQRGCRAVLLNPGVDPARDLADAIGTTTAWHSGEPFEFRPEYVEELRAHFALAGRPFNFTTASSLSASNCVKTFGPSPPYRGRYRQLALHRIL